MEKEKTKYDNINHPIHYTNGNIECIEFIEDNNFNFHLGNAIKYITRAGKKDKKKNIEDLEKAVWYIDRYIYFIIQNQTYFNKITNNNYKPYKSIKLESYCNDKKLSQNLSLAIKNIIKSENQNREDFIDCLYNARNSIISEIYGIKKTENKNE